MSSKAKIFITVLITAFVTCIVTLAAVGVWSLRSYSGGGFGVKLEILDRILETYYLYDYDKEELSESAAKAYVAALDEPYTEYYTPEEFSSYTENLQDGYTGIGIIVSVDDEDNIVVVAPFENSPAYEAGIEPGDILKAVDGVDYKGAELSQAVSVIRGGQEGTVVNVTIIKKDSGEVNLNIERRDISDESVKTEMLEGDIGYMRISQFNTKSEDGSHSTSTEFEEGLKKLQDEGSKRLIIDLRDNPGGVLTEVCSVADRLLPEGIITYIEDKNGRRKDYNSDADYTDIPLVVLINGNSASASEVLTGALKDYGRATVVGEKSFGKGIVQDVYTLPGGAGISLTTSKYYTPNGICIHEIGIEPDVEVPMPEEYRNVYASTVERDKDTQLKKAIEIIKEK